MALALAAVCTVAQAGSAAHHLREHVPWRTVGVSAAVRVVTLLCGLWALRWLTTIPPDGIRFWVGLVMLAFVVLQWAWQPAPRPRLHPGWGGLAFAASGFTAGLCGMGGPPLVLWVMAHNWSAESTRAFLFASFALLVPVQLTVLYLTFGRDALTGAGFGLALMPVALLGSWLGLRVGARFSKPVLRRVAFALLLVTALQSMLPRLLGLLHRLG
jgi:uncharacterized protein